MISIKKTLGDQSKTQRKWTRAEYFAHCKNKLEGAMLQNILVDMAGDEFTMRVRGEHDRREVADLLYPLRQTTGYAFPRKSSSARISPNLPNWFSQRLHTAPAAVSVTPDEKDKKQRRLSKSAAPRLMSRNSARNKKTYLDSKVDENVDDNGKNEQEMIERTERPKKKRSGKYKTSVTIVEEKDTMMTRLKPSVMDTQKRSESGAASEPNSSCRLPQSVGVKRVQVFSLGDRPKTSGVSSTLCNKNAHTSIKTIFQGGNDISKEITSQITQEQTNEEVECTRLEELHQEAPRGSLCSDPDVLSENACGSHVFIEIPGRDADDNDHNNRTLVPERTSGQDNDTLVETEEALHLNEEAQQYGKLENNKCVVSGDITRNRISVNTNSESLTSLQEHDGQGSSVPLGCEDNTALKILEKGFGKCVKPFPNADVLTLNESSDAKTTANVNFDEGLKLRDGSDMSGGSDSRCTDCSDNAPSRYSLYPVKFDCLMISAGNHKRIIGRGPLDKPKCLVEREQTQKMFNRTVSTALANNRFRIMEKKPDEAKEEVVKEKEVSKEPARVGSSKVRERAKSGVPIAQFVRAVEAGLRVDHLSQPVTSLKVPISTSRTKREKQRLMRPITLLSNSAEMERQRMAAIQQKIHSFLGNLPHETELEN